MSQAVILLTIFVIVRLYLEQIYCNRKSDLVLTDIFLIFHSVTIFYIKQKQKKNNTQRKIKFDTRQSKNPIPFNPAEDDHPVRFHSMKSWFALHTYTRTEITFIVRPCRKGWFFLSLTIPNFCIPSVILSNERERLRDLIFTIDLPSTLCLNKIVFYF